MLRRGLYCPETERDACGVGFVAHIRGQKSREIVDQALEVLRRLSHRAATGADPRRVMARSFCKFPMLLQARGSATGFDMPHRRGYASAWGSCRRTRAPARLRAGAEEVVAEEGQRLLGWRDVPIDEAQAGPTARAVLPVIRQVYIARRRLVPTAFERKLYVIRKLTENRVRERAADIDPDGRFHVASLSAETIVYKGLLLPGAWPRFYRDLEIQISGPSPSCPALREHTFRLGPAQRFASSPTRRDQPVQHRNWSNARTSLLSSGKFASASSGCSRHGPVKRLGPSTTC